MSEQGNNPKNNDSPLFRALTKFLSGPITRYQRQNPRQLKRWQLDKYKFTSPAGLSFKKTAYSPFDNVYSKSLASISRSERYVDFDQMEYTPEIDMLILIRWNILQRLLPHSTFMLMR
jgi:hypothetical protein